MAFVYTYYIDSASWSNLILCLRYTLCRHNEHMHEGERKVTVKSGRGGRPLAAPWSGEYA